MALARGERQEPDCLGVGQPTRDHCDCCGHHSCEKQWADEMNPVTGTGTSQTDASGNPIHMYVRFGSRGRRPRSKQRE
jgi:hypothetical protein